MAYLELWHDDRNVNMIGLYIVWCTKYRRKVIDGGVEVVVKQVIQQTCEDNGWALRSIEIMPDHICLFVQIYPTDSPVNVVKILKSTSAIALFYRFPELKKQKFWGSGLWSRGAYYGSVGQISQATIQRYIENQKSK